MKVSLDVLQRVYETFQNGDNNEEEGHSQLDPESHLCFIDAYEMPLWNWSTERSTFERSHVLSNLPSSLADTHRDS